MADPRAAARRDDRPSTPAECLAHLVAILDGVDNAPQLAAQLIAEFGSLAATLAGSAPRIGRATGSDAAVRRLTGFRKATTYALRSRLFAAPLLSNWQALLDYLHADMSHRCVERVRILHLNIRNCLIRDEVISEGTLDSSSIYVREVIARSLQLGSASLILVHNHPSGDPSPSRADIEITKTVAQAGKLLGIAVYDHLIIGSDKHVSLRAQGLI